MAMGKGEVLLEGTDLFVNLLNLFKGSGGDLSGRLGQFMKSGGAKIIAQQMPRLFGIGFSENSLTLDILQRTEKVNPGSAAKLEKLADGMNDYERYFFWMTITSIQLQKVATKQQSKPVEKVAQNDQAGTEEIIYQPISEAELDNRVQSLLFIVKLFEQHEEDAAATIRAMYSLRVIEQSWLIRVWSYFSTAIKEKILDPNGVTSIKELINAQGLLESLKKRNATLRAEVKKGGDNVDHPSIFIWGLLWTQGGTRGARFRDVYEVHLIIRFAKWIQKLINAHKAKKALRNRPLERKMPTFGKKE